jgi:hypothetical protein
MPTSLLDLCESPARVMKGFILALLKERIQELERKGFLSKGK